MVVKSVKHQQEQAGEKGQSLLEFLLLLPVLLGLVSMMVKANTAIQVSIVNQQYARAQALFLTYNSPVFPQNRLRQESLTGRGYNQMVIGVSADKVEDASTPVATVQQVARKGVQGNENSAEEPELRAAVRVRTNVVLCTQQNVLADGKAILRLGGGDFEAVSTYALNEGSTFQPCRSPL
ncbi:MAG: hypothetical protein A2X94_16775 [Bdellovibrionales bacterium GWB1_55_8]|nr:MAG: hypothetical protein A2X94_16775 [Bdellovibrionales bacterium GWB1_55_8]